MQQELKFILTSIYNKLNDKYFDNELPSLPMIITTKKYYLACCRARNHQPISINVSIDNIKSDDPVEEITAAILHEMIHEYCIINRIPHYDPQTGTHLPGFIKAANEHGLIYDDCLNINFLVDDINEIFERG